MERVTARNQKVTYSLFILKSISDICVQNSSLKTAMKCQNEVAALFLIQFK
jgi:hypothetical protein